MPGDFLSEAQRAAYSRTLGLRRSGCSRPEDLSVHSCSIATQTSYSRLDSLTVSK